MAAFDGGSTLATGRAEAWGNATPTNSNQVFIPEMWSDEVIAAYKSHLVLANLVTKMSHVGKKGDTIHIPTPTRQTANAKAENVAVTLITQSESKIAINIDKHFEYPRLVEDIVEVQALPSYRRFYTDDAGFGLAKMVDHHLHVLGTGLQGGTVDSTAIDTPGGNLTYGSGAVIGSDGSTAWDLTGAGNGAALTDAGIRKMIQTLDDVDIPMSDRYLVIPPVEKKSLLGLSRFTEQAFVGEVGGANSIRNGLVGDIYGVKVFVSTNCGNVVDTGGTNAFRAAMLLHKSAFAFVEQMTVRSQSQYMQEYLAFLYTADTIYGTGELRDTAGIVAIVPA